MGLILNILYNQEKYENNNNDIIIDIKDDVETNRNYGICGDIQYTDYRDYRHIHYEKTLLRDNGIIMLG